MGKVQFKCSKCGVIVEGYDERSAEMAFDRHECAGMRNLKDMPTDLLIRLAKKEITEVEAWKLADKR